DTLERPALLITGDSAALNQMQPEAIEEGRVTAPNGAQDVGGKPSVAGTGFDEIETGIRMGGGRQQCRHFGKLNPQKLAEERPDIDAGKKIARASGSLGRAGVVAELGVVESQIHE